MARRATDWDGPAPAGPEPLRKPLPSMTGYVIGYAFIGLCFLCGLVLLIVGHLIIGGGLVSYVLLRAPFIPRQHRSIVNRRNRIRAANFERVWEAMWETMPPPSDALAEAEAELEALSAPTVKGRMAQLVQLARKKRGECVNGCRDGCQCWACMGHSH